jgi:uridine kinase
MQQCLSVKFPSGKIVDFPRNTNLSKIIQDEEFESFEKNELIAIKLNGIVTSINTTVIYSKCTIHPVLMNSYEGLNVYQSSLCFLLKYATFLVLQNVKYTLIVEHQLNTGLQITLKLYEKEEIKNEISKKILEKMKQLVDDDLPLEKKILSHEEALEYFEKNQKGFSVELIKSLNNPDVFVNAFDDSFYSLFNTPLVGKTSQIGKDFDLVPNENGLLLTLSHRSSYIKMDYFNKSLIPVYQDSIKWGIKINMKCVGQLNRAISENKGKDIKQFIALCEARHNQKINEISANFIEQITFNGNKRLILIAGPSASNKTTFARKLCIELFTRGYKTQVLSVDDYYK